MNPSMTDKKMLFGTPEQKGNVTIYPAAPPEMLRATYGRKKRTAAYVRVSTDTIEQEGSLILQREYYENHIKNDPEYEFAGIYADDGITGTTIVRRKGFQDMIDDCLAGKLDLILTKSISRFARNTADTLLHINILNALPSPVEIYFELERISTFNPTSEGYIAFMAMIAQEESHSKSESITWAVDKRYAQGKFYVFPVLGYDKEKGQDKPLTINEEEAKTIKLCYAMTVMGHSFVAIANRMNSLGLKSKPGNVNWTVSGVRSLLSNEKYAGHLCARKTVTPNYKTHKSKKNQGEKPQYFVEGHHDPIVPPLAYEVALRIIKNRQGNSAGIPLLTAVPEGALRGFVAVNKYVRGYTLDDYTEASQSVYAEDEVSEICIPADRASIFDLRTYNIVSTISFDDHRTKPSCSIQNGKITFNGACKKVLGAGESEILFHPSKAILAVRSPVDEKVVSEGVKTVNPAKPVSLSKFIPIALESAGLHPDYRYRVYGTRRTKKGECIMLFDLRDAEIVPSEKDAYILPDKYAGGYGAGYYENLAACDLHKIDIDGLWQALQESRPADVLAGQIVELTEFCKDSLAEFGFNNE